MSMSTNHPQNSSTTAKWSPSQYLKFSSERTRPALDLLSHVTPFLAEGTGTGRGTGTEAEAEAESRGKRTIKIIDLGCGPGTSTAVLADAFRNANAASNANEKEEIDIHILGVDSSPEMIEKARNEFSSSSSPSSSPSSSAPTPTVSVSFTLADISSPTITSTSLKPLFRENVDLVFANAVLQWISKAGRFPLMQRVIDDVLRPGGVFAYQVPDNLQEASHVLMRRVAKEGPWRERFYPTSSDAGSAAADEPGKSKPKFAGREPVETPEEVYGALWEGGRCSVVDVFRLTYYHPLEGVQEIVEWVKGTGLRPYLDVLEDGEVEAFLEEYRRQLEREYPVVEMGGKKSNTVLFRFPRLFVVAVKGE